MDVLILLMGLTLITAGWVLIWEFTRFLHCAYAVQGRVVSLEPGYGMRKKMAQPGKASYSFFPVIEYQWQGDRIRFTSLDDKCIAGLQIGDQVQLSFSRSRRKHTRIGRLVALMIASMTMLVAGILGGAMLLGQQVDVIHILLGSVVLAICLFIIVLYLRQQDETAADSVHHVRRRVLNCVFLQEPTNVCHWRALFTNRRQRRRIWASRVLGGGCLATGAFLFAAAFFLGGAGLAPQLSGGDYTADAEFVQPAASRVVQHTVIRN
ncbi:DUF3592 domain-containing protein [Hahella sp. KA22]|uniref:DUF3592 domain-containing protein n=1 Tax=Hahella sp. KA22 TaxID=1628392 RepID=UPI000FDEF3C9|nr:DUF3592 domain-containing protein [Hahella sp. KA22]AZZ90427.1 DUF3592 domain-containing protein [Hahella sp. KA22]QAY53797.1 DUF3592 domain-containing protein [Hahella sp. KA22]